MKALSDGCRSACRAATALTLLSFCVLAAHAQTPTFERPLRAIHISGNWGSNETVVAEWERNGGDILPPDYVRHLRSLNVDWVGISVGLEYDDSMDRTIEPAASGFSDVVLRQLIREFRQHGLQVYVTLYLDGEAASVSERPAQRWQLGAPCTDASIRPENWPWNPSHPDHAEFVHDFWTTYTGQAVHYARIAQEEGVRMYSLGTETDNLFRTRSEGGDCWSYHFARELSRMVESVRHVYDGLLTYDMHYVAITDDWPGSKDLWRDLDLDVVGVSAWFPLADRPPSEVAAVGSLRSAYERIVEEHLLPLRSYNGRPVVFLEYGAIDRVDAPANPALPDHSEFVFEDGNGNGVDDGWETQANMLQAWFEVMDRYPDVVHGAFLWDNWLASDELWGEYWAGHGNFSVRDKPAEDVVRAQYAKWKARFSGGLAAEPAGDSAVSVYWRGDWVDAARGTLVVEARSPKMGWTELASVPAGMGRVRLEGLDANTPYTFRLRTESGGSPEYSEEASATTGDAAGACRRGGRYLCLAAGRFEVQAHWKNHNQEGVYGLGRAVPIDVSDESGMFWFFNSSNIELVVKTLDGRGVNGHYWVFFGALSDVEYWVTVRDTVGGGRRTYHNPPAENCGQSDTMAFVPAGASSASAADVATVGPGFELVPVSAASIDLAGVIAGQEGGGTCEASETRLCLQGDRFSVDVELVDPNDMQRKAGKVVSSVGTNETGFFWFFTPTNVELATKLLDGRAQNGKYWFLYGGLSDVEYTITLTDTVTGESRPYRNEAGSLCGGIDINALPR